MDFYTESMMKIVGMPKKVTLYGKSVPTELLFSPSMAESLLYWHASNISMNLHGEVLLDTRVVSAPDEVSGTRLESLTKEFSVQGDNPAMGLAASLMILSAAGDDIISPMKKHRNFYFAPLIMGFREAVRVGYDKGDVLKANDFKLASVFYDTIVKPARDVRYQPPAISQGVKREQQGRS